MVSFRRRVRIAGGRFWCAASNSVNRTCSTSTLCQFYNYCCFILMFVRRSCFDTRQIAALSHRVLRVVTVRGGVTRRSSLKSDALSASSSSDAASSSSSDNDDDIDDKSSASSKSQEQKPQSGLC